MSFALRLKSRPRNSQPPWMAGLVGDVDTVSTATIAQPGKFRAAVGVPFDLTGGAAVATILTKLGSVAVQQTASNFFSRVRPWPLAGGRMFSFAVQCDTSGATQGVWSVAATEVSGTPYLLLQRNNADLRLFVNGAYIITFTGVAAAGAFLKVAFGFTNLAVSGTGVAYMAVNGVVKSAAYTNSANSAATEYLYSGYSTQCLCAITDWISVPWCHAEQIAKLSVNPWQVFAP